MKTKFWIFLIIAVVTVLAVLFWNSPGVDEPATIDAGAQQSQGARSVNPSNAEASERTSVDAPAAEVARLTEALVETNAAVEIAQSRLDDLSLSLDNVEAQVADIEARGDDPADHADEVMPYMQPVLDEYMDVQSELDTALERRHLIEAELAEARRNSTR